jgi:hypothetical protein
VHWTLKSFQTSNPLKDNSELFRKRYFDETSGDIIFPDKLIPSGDGQLCALDTQNFSCFWKYLEHSTHPQLNLHQWKERSRCQSFVSLSRHTPRLRISLCKELLDSGIRNHSALGTARGSDESDRKTQFIIIANFRNKMIYSYKLTSFYLEMRISWYPPKLKLEYTELIL